MEQFTVIGPEGSAFGPYTHAEALRVQERLNAGLSVDEDGEGYCDYLVVPGTPQQYA